MKLLIDTENKTIEIKEDVSLREIVLFLQKTLPNWEEYSLKRSQVISYYPYYYTHYYNTPIGQPPQYQYGTAYMGTSANTTQELKAP